MHCFSKYTVTVGHWNATNSEITKIITQKWLLVQKTRKLGLTIEEQDIQNYLSLKHKWR
jgi:hypothetical protein